jgi:uncharacterized protein (TIGR00369 family)
MLPFRDRQPRARYAGATSPGQCPARLSYSPDMTPASFGRAPVNAFLGLELIRHDEREAEVRMPAREEFAQEYGVVHGGLLTALADTAAVYLTQPRLGEGERMTSIELKVNFLEGARPGAGDLRAIARLVRGGKRVVVCESRVYQGDREILIGLFTYLRS